MASMLPTDHGFVVVRPDDNGTRKIMVCDSVVAGEPRNVYAVHFKCTRLTVHPGVRMVNDELGSYTREVVEVFCEERGSVHLRAMRRGENPVMDAIALGQ
jgi:hypothetical protein